MSLPIPLTYPPMEAQTATAIPRGNSWQYEPKWDGFRCLAFRDGKTVSLRSKSGQVLERYFPELVERLLSLDASRFVVDGEIIVPENGGVSFDWLLQRIHPAESRIRKLAREHPATLIVFDLLVDDRGALVAEQPLAQRRKRLEKFAARYFHGIPGIALSPATPVFEIAQGWFADLAGGLDGIIAKDTGLPYQSGLREGMLKIKNLRTADCVAGGFRYASKGKLIGSVLLGLYGEDGLLHHVGFTSSIPAAAKPELTKKLESLVKPPGFTGRAPGGLSRWSTERSAEWQPLAHRLVLEVQYDHFSGGRFRHGTKFLRWRPDKRPEQCTSSQVERESRSPLDLLMPA